MPTLRRRVMNSAACPCLLDADWCLRSDVMTNSRLQALGLEKSDALQASGDDQVRDLRTELHAFRQEMVDRLTAMSKAFRGDAEFLGEN